MHNTSDQTETSNPKASNWIAPTFVESVPHIFQERGVTEILQRASQDFFRLGGPFVAAILKPVLFIYVGAYGSMWCALSLEKTVNPFLPLLASLALLGMMCVGFWEMLVYFASLNRSYWHALNNGKPDFQADYKAILSEHKPALLWYINGLVVIQLVAVVGLSLLTIPLNFFFPDYVSGIIIQAFTLLIYAWFALGFQVIAFGKPDGGIIGVMKQSRTLVSEGFGSCYALLVVSFLVTYYAIPGLVVMLAELSGLIGWFNQLHEGLITSYIAMLPTIPVDIPSSTEISHQVSQSLLTGAVNSLLLPWGTFVCALLYGSLAVKKLKAASEQ